MDLNAEQREGLRRARVVAEWEIGDPSWANMLIGAFLEADHPAYVEAAEGLKEDLDRQRELRR